MGMRITLPSPEEGKIQKQYLSRFREKKKKKKRPNK